MHEATYKQQSYVRQSICSVSSPSVCLCKTELALLHSLAFSELCGGQKWSHSNGEKKCELIHKIALVALSLWNVLTSTPTLQRLVFVLLMCESAISSHSQIVAKTSQSLAWHNAVPFTWYVRKKWGISEKFSWRPDLKTPPCISLTKVSSHSDF